MMRLVSCTALALLIAAGASLSSAQGQEKGKGKGKGQFGKVVKVDAATGTLTVMVRQRGGEEMEKTFKISDKTKCICFKDTERKEVTSKEALKDLKKDDRVRIQADKDGNIKQITINPPRRKPKGG